MKEIISPAMLSKLKVSNEVTSPIIPKQVSITGIQKENFQASFKKISPYKPTQIGAVFTMIVALEIEVKSKPQCHPIKSDVNAIEAMKQTKQLFGFLSLNKGIFLKVIRQRMLINGKANNILQKTAHEGDISDNLKKIGANPIKKPPIKRDTKGFLNNVNILEQAMSKIGNHDELQIGRAHV